MHSIIAYDLPLMPVALLFRFLCLRFALGPSLCVLYYIKYTLVGPRLVRYEVFVAIDSLAGCLLDASTAASRSRDTE